MENYRLTYILALYFSAFIYIYIVHGNSRCRTSFSCLSAVGVSPPEASTLMTMEDNPYYSTVQGGLVMQISGG